MKHLLSKSTYIRGLQCHKSLYLNKHFQSLRDPLSAKQQAIFKRGHSVGELARKLFPGGIDAFPGSYMKSKEWVQKTSELIAAETSVIYEAAFMYNQVLAAVDILVKVEDGWKAYEVKSSVRISPTYIKDASLQYYVISGSGIPLLDFSLVHVNNEYILGDTLEVNRLFAAQSCLKEVQQSREEVAAKVTQLKEVIGSGSAPDVQIGEHCFYPYTCDFKGHCWKHVPEQGSVFDLGGLRKADIFALYHKGRIRMDDLTETDLSSADAKIQLRSFQSRKPHVEKELLQTFISGLVYPLIFMDFETFMPAVPVYKGAHPYEQIPFQYSIHVIRLKGAEPEHFEFVAQPGKDPRKEFIESLLQTLGTEGSILAYNATFERSILHYLATLFPEMKTQIGLAIARMSDLMDPFKKRMFYNYTMKGSASIKSVLPALVPGFSYEGLQIGDGASAMSAYEDLLYSTDLFEIAETISSLKEYCKMDTLAMIMLYRELERVIDEPDSLS